MTNDIRRSVSEVTGTITTDNTQPARRQAHVREFLHRVRASQPVQRPREGTRFASAAAHCRRIRRKRRETGRAVLFQRLARQHTCRTPQDAMNLGRNKACNGSVPARQGGLLLRRRWCSCPCGGCARWELPSTIPVAVTRAGDSGAWSAIGKQLNGPSSGPSKHAQRPTPALGPGAVGEARLFCTFPTLRR